MESHTRAAMTAKRTKSKHQSSQASNLIVGELGDVNWSGNIEGCGGVKSGGWVCTEYEGRYLIYPIAHLLIENAELFCASTSSPANVAGLEYVTFQWTLFGC
jgi:hypothetical protein